LLKYVSKSNLKLRSLSLFKKYTHEVKNCTIVNDWAYKLGKGKGTKSLVIVNCKVVEWVLDNCKQPLLMTGRGYYLNSKQKGFYLGVLELSEERKEKVETIIK
jgi:hypothetical protein